MFIELIKSYALTIVFLIQSAIIGFAFLQLLLPVDAQKKQIPNYYLKWFFAISLGIFFNIVILFMLGIAGLLNQTVVVGAGMSLCAISLVTLWRLQKNSFQLPFNWYFLDTIVLFLLFTITITCAMHPPGSWDDTMYQLPVSRSYLEHQAIFVNEWVRFPLFPQNINLLITLGLMLGGDLVAQVFATLPLFITALGLLGASLWITGSIIPGVIGSATLFSLGTVTITLGYAYIDNGLALFCWGAILSIALWLESGDKRSSKSWLIIAGILAGAAAGSKYFGLVLAGFIGIYLLVLRKDFKASLIFGITLILAGSWWYIRSFILSGDPIHPAGGNIFGYYLWDAQDLINQKSEQSSHGVAPGSLNIIGALKAAGVILPMGLAIGSLLLRNLSRPLGFFQFIFISYLLFWFFVTQVDRYLAPIYGVAILLASYVLYAIYPLTWIKPFLDTKPVKIQSATAFTIILLCLFPLAGKKYYKANEAMNHWQYILEHYPGYRTFSEANSLIPTFGNKLVHVGFENAIYFFDGIAIGDWFGPGRYRDMMNCNNPDKPCEMVEPEKMKALMNKFGAKILAIPKERLPTFDKNIYLGYFDLVSENDEGVLMTLKPD